MSKWFPVFLLITCAVALLAPQVCHAQADIIPGKGIWKDRLGMTNGQMLRDGTNPPESVSHVRGGVQVDSWDDGTTLLLKGGKVIQIAINNEAESTPAGVSPGSTLAEVRAHYPNLVHTRYRQLEVPGQPNDAADIYDDVADGIAFEFSTSSDAKHHVEMDSILVHLPGHAVIPPLDDKPLMDH